MPHEQDLQEEQQFLDRAYEGLEAMRADAARMLQSVLDVGRGGTFQSRTERDIVVRTSMARLAQLDIGDQALCFGRIDRAPEPGLPEGETFHIGRLAVSGEDLEPLVVDWRAPVAEPFYRATGLDPQGLARRRHLAVSGRTVTGVEDEYFALPGGAGRPEDRNGSSGGPSGVGAPAAAEGLELGGPGALLAALGHARTGQMADIVATIQREQDEIIRSPLAGVLMVQGGPGTGKTAVALHRAAYLLYTHRFPLERQGVLVVGPNPLFLRYIERVLPSLGETGVTLSTVSGLVPEIRVRASEDADLARLKGDARMATFLSRAVRTRQRPLRHDVDVPFGATTLRLRASDTAHVVAAASRRHGPHNARRRYVEHQVTRLLAEQYDRARRRSGAGMGSDLPRPGPAASDVPGAASDVPGAASAVQGAASDVQGAGGRPGAGAGSGGAPEATVEGLAELQRQLRRVPAVAEALDRIWPRLSPHELIHDLFGARPLLTAAGRGLLSEQEAASLHRPRSSSLDQVPWTTADAALVDEARALLGPRRRSRPRADARERTDRARDEAGFWPAGLSVSPAPSVNGHSPTDEDVRSFGHIVVDEAQDLSPMQLRMLARRSISGSMTVVGDIAQATGPWSPTSWNDVAAHLTPARAPRVVELTVGYRTPAEVMEVAAGVLAAAGPGLTPPRPVRRSGERPTRTEVPPGALAEGVATVAAREMGAVGAGRTAVLVPDALLPVVTSALAGRGLDPVDPRDPAGPGLAAPLVVLPAAESHGLEFDAVVVVEPAAIAAGRAGGNMQAIAAGHAEDAARPAAAGNGKDAARPSAAGNGKAADEQSLRPVTAGLRALYVALTRPTRRLAVVHSEPLPEGLSLS